MGKCIHFCPFQSISLMTFDFLAFRLKPVFSIPLHIPIQTVVVVPGNTHILAPLRDGRLAVIGLTIPTSNKHNTVSIV